MRKILTSGATITIVLMLWCSQLASAQNNFYVKEGATGTGSSWGDANGDLQAVINNAALGDSILVAEGTYRPIRKADDLTTITLNDRDNAFVLKNGVKLLGGFPASGNPGIGERDWDSYPTILSGDLLANDIVTGSGATLTFSNITDNSLHVVISAGNQNETELNGFVISGGYANLTGPLTVNGQNIEKELGGGFYSIASVSIIRNVRFTHNRAIYAGGLLITESPISSVENCVFENNYVTQWGGAIYTNLSSPEIDSCNFENNYGAQYGGAMLNFDSSPTISNSSFISNVSNRGGAMRNSNSSPQITNTVFTTNLGNMHAGAIINLSASSPHITNSTFDGNTTIGFGGAMINSNSSPQIDSTIFVNNQAVQGGAIQNESSASPIVSNTTFESNSADFGGAILNFSATATINKSNFEFNIANTSGGAIYCHESTPEIDSSIFNANSADEGGALFNNLSSPTISNTTFDANTALLYGGAIRNYDSSSPIITNVTFENNDAAEYGGAINNYLNSSPTILNSVFTNNTSNRGGAMSNYENAAPLIINSLIHHNAAAFGGGLYNFLNSNPEISSSTIARNDADQGGGMYNEDESIPTFSNSIILGNTATLSDSSIYNSANSSYDAYFSLIEGVQNTSNGNIDALDIEVDDVFTNADNNDFTLLLTCSGNPAIDAGSNALIPTGVLNDIVGNDRIYGDSTDLGAYEVNSTVNDVFAPIADVATLSDVTAECEVTSLTAPTATDNCAGSISGTHDVTLPITAQGTTVITWTYDDGNGNATTQTQNVVINDVTIPVVDLATLADVTTECEVTSLTAPTATDNCAGALTGTHDVTLPITASGTTVVTWTYDDGNGNTTSQTQHIIITPIDNAVTQVDAITLTADASGYTYQWVDCDNGNLPILGETSQTFSASANGNYAVVVDNGTCSDTSICMAINSVSIKELAGNEQIVLFPNPTRGLVQIESSSEVKAIEVLSVNAQLVLRTEETTIDLSAFEDGFYFVRIILSNSNVIVRKVELIKY